ncbi:MAG TPA: cation diffusion facilitator family transporter [Chitinophagaceae bacterium]|nr:cation diffusion facilitator family transporter [Sediminibacterium sp.]HBT94565.1 cation diffusion facilitator family transporter [Chitinophagaceae bacterium]
MQKSKQNLKIQFFVTSLSIVLFVLKFVAYYMTHSLSVLSDALESIVNVIAGLIGLYSLYVASKPKDKDHPYGHGKAEFISAAFEGSLIITAGGIILYESIITFFEPSSLHNLDNGIWVLLSTAVLNMAAGLIAKAIGKKNNSLALTSSGQHLLIDSYTTYAVVIGIGLVLFTGYNGIDTSIAVGMGIWIIYNGYKIIRESLAGIMDEADMALLDAVIQELNLSRHTNWIDLHNLRVIKYGALMHIDCHLTVPWYFNVNEAHAAVDEFTKLIKNKFGDSVEFFVHTDGCMPFSCAICTIENCEKRNAPFKEKLAWNRENVLSDLKHQLA